MFRMRPFLGTPVDFRYHSAVGERPLPRNVDGSVAEKTALEEGGLEISDLLEDTGLVENAMEKADRGDAGLRLENAVPSSDLGKIGLEDDMKKPGLEVVDDQKAGLVSAHNLANGA